MSKIIDWSGYEWLTQERWGQIHPDKPWNWYDETCVKTVNNELHLDIQYHPKEFDINGSLVTSLFGTGLITCETDFSFGKFEIEAKLPQGSGLWPAFWLYPRNAWPPEIDIFEAYSKNSNYRNNFLKPYNIQSCIHTRKGWDSKKIPAQSPWFFEFNKRPDTSFNKYSCEWTNKKIEFFINDKSIRKITDLNIINNISKYKMRVIINNHIDGRYKNQFYILTPFIIKYFKYTPYNG